MRKSADEDSAKGAPHLLRVRVVAQTAAARHKHQYSSFILGNTVILVFSAQTLSKARTLLVIDVYE